MTRVINLDVDNPIQTRLKWGGNRAAPILVVCDVPTELAWRSNVPIAGAEYATFMKFAEAVGFTANDFAYICPCDPMPEQIKGSEKREGEHVNVWRDEFVQLVSKFHPQLIVYLGNKAGRAVTGRPVKITKARGVVQTLDNMNAPVFPMFAPGYVLARPEAENIYTSDFAMLRRIANSGWNIEDAYRQVGEVNYRYIRSYAELCAAIPTDPGAMFIDTETTGLDWWKDEHYPFILQICVTPGDAIAIPINWRYAERLGVDRNQYRAMWRRVKGWLENPEIYKAGHNIKFDKHMLESIGIRVQGYTYDTQLLAFAVDENMLDKSQDECVRRWVPEMAGYADMFNQEFDKSKMIEHAPEDILAYSCGDADSGMRLTRQLLTLLNEDQRQANCYNRVMLPALLAFHEAETWGIAVDVDELSALGTQLDEEYALAYDQLISQVPVTLKRAHAERGLQFTRPDFVRDILFSPQGLGLRPRVFTKSTRNLDPQDRIPSISAKDHLPYFDDVPFVTEMIQFKKLEKMRSTYVGHQAIDDDDDDTGFWQHIHDGLIHPSFLLHRTVTGRSSSVNPNAQNWPKRGRLASAFRRIFVARPGYVLIETDLSQIELRIAAWMAMEAVMLEIYRNGGDIHSSTAAAIMGMTMEQFRQLPDEERDLARFRAKAVNFGFLYGMGWRKFMAYAKTDYGINLTEAEAQFMRNTFFRLYPQLAAWHMAMRDFVRENGYVRALHGALRRLPSINSYDEVIRSMAERQAINSPVQRFGSDLGLIAKTRMTRDADPDLFRPIAFIHDAVIAECREEYAEQGMAAAMWYMTTPPLEEWFGLRCPIPITADVSWGYNLRDMNKGSNVVPIMPDWARPELDMAA